MRFAARRSRCCVRPVLALVTLAAAFGSSTAAPPGPKLAPVVAVAAPALELKDVAGKLHRLGDYRGRIVLVNFWATWCEPCREEMPSMQALKRRLDKESAGQLVILAVNYGENAERIEQFLRKQPLDFPVLLDPFSEAWRAWKPALLPASFIVGRDGRLRYRVVGELDWMGVEAGTVLKRLLDEKT